MVMVIQLQSYSWMISVQLLVRETKASRRVVLWHQGGAETDVSSIKDERCRNLPLPNHADERGTHSGSGWMVSVKNRRFNPQISCFWRSGDQGHYWQNWCHGWVNIVWDPSSNQLHCLDIIETTSFDSGDVGKDIELSLTDDTLLKIEVRNSSGILVLASQLDREGVSGPSSIVTSVLCQKLGLESEDTDPGFVIPIRVRWVT